MPNAKGGRTGEAPDLSVIVVSWNTRALLERCLAAVYSGLRRSPEVIVVDNASIDGSAEMVAERFPRCILLRNRRNLGFAEANNQGFRIARGRYLLLLNSDAAPLPGTVDGLLDYLEGHPHHGAACGQLIYEDGRRQESYSRFPTFLGLLAVHTSLRYREPGRRQIHRWRKDCLSDVTCDVDQASAACLLLRRDVLSEAGLFDTGCFLLYNDVDLCRRIRAAGYRIAFLPHLKTIHTGSASCNEYANFDLESLRNAGHYVRKHYGPFAAWLFWLMTRADRLRLRLHIGRNR